MCRYRTGDRVHRLKRITVFFGVFFGKKMIVKYNGLIVNAM